MQTRFYAIDGAAGQAGGTVADLDGRLSTAAVEVVVHEGATLDPAPDLAVAPGDVVGVTGYVGTLERDAAWLGAEVSPPHGVHVTEERRGVVVTSEAIADHTLAELRDTVNVDARHGVFPRRLRRLGHTLPLLPGVELHRGDEVELVCRPADLDRVTGQIGHRISAAQLTDYVFFGLGMALGVALGLLAITVGGVPITLGTGGWCLVSGLLFGWLRSTHPRYAALPIGASNFLRDFGLAVFVGVVGLTAGPQAIASLRDNGALLFALGIIATMLPMIIVFPISYYVFRIRTRSTRWRA